MSSTSGAEEEEPKQAPEEAAQAARFIVVGVDGSKQSSAALAWAAEEAALRGTSLEVVHAWQLPALAYGDIAVPVSFEGLGTAAAAMLDEQVTSVLGEHPPVPLVREVREGPAAQVILEVAKGAEMVVLGSRGRGGFTGLLLGSVSGHVSHHAHCPVTIVRNGD